MKDKVVIITGASSGIGLACAREFVRLKAKVVLAARSIEKLNTIVSELDPRGSNCLAVKTDVTSETDCQNMVKQAIDKFGTIDILVNNAGISMRAIFDDVEIQVLKRVIDVNLWGTIYCTKFALPYIQKSKGVIVAISSIGGFHGLPGRTAYSASKFAIHGFMESIRTENMKKGVHVLVLAASFTATNIRINALDAHGKTQGSSPRDESHIDSPARVARNLIRSIRKRKRTRIMSFEGQLMVLFQRVVPLLTDWIVYNKFANEPDSPIK
jgi:NAD(P)-dependent dehydrogenase (short-subunit alcohol dehydrogenase family)